MFNKLLPVGFAVIDVQGRGGWKVGQASISALVEVIHEGYCKDEAEGCNTPTSKGWHSVGALGAGRNLREGRVGEDCDMHQHAYATFSK